MEKIRSLKGFITCCTVRYTHAGIGPEDIKSRSF